MVFMSPRRKQVRKVLYYPKKRRYNTVISHVNSNESNNWNISNSDNLILASNLPRSSVQNDS